VAVLALALLAQAQARAGQAISVLGGAWRLSGRVYRSPHVSKHPHLVVILHGDAPFENPSYHYALAERATGALDNIIAVGLLRPGYSDGQGGTSQGSRGFAIGDNYSSADIASIAGAIRQLARRYTAQDLTLVGHSGGAAIAADILALYPHLASRALLVSCPCDVSAFRMRMLRVQWNPLWLLPVDAISPKDHVREIPHDTRIRLVAGSNDPITPPWLAYDFQRAVRQHGGNCDVVLLKNLGHDILLEPRVLSELRDILSNS
jgi:predicted esterase